MASGRVLNYSGDSLVVFHSTEGSLKGNVLEDGRISPDGIEPAIIVHRESADHAIRDYQNGWKLEPACRTHVYRRSGAIVLFGPVEHDLHCIPEDVARLEPAYSKAEIGDTKGVAIDTSASWGDVAPAMGPLDGYNEIPWKNFFTFWERKTARYIRTGENITLRIDLAPVANFTLQQLSAVHAAIKNALRKYWNAAPNPSGSSKAMVFRVELVSEQEDARVQLRKKPPKGSKEPNNLEEWWDDISPESVAHEFGHLLGLMDEYCVYKRLDKANQSVKTAKDMCDAEERDYPGRYERRAKVGKCPTGRVVNVMERDDTPADTRIDESLIDSVFKRRMCNRRAFVNSYRVCCRAKGVGGCGKIHSAEYHGARALRPA